MENKAIRPDEVEKRGAGLNLAQAAVAGGVGGIAGAATTWALGRLAGEGNGGQNAPQAETSPEIELPPGLATTRNGDDTPDRSPDPLAGRRQEALHEALRRDQL